MPKSRSVQVLKSDEPWMYITLVDGTVIKHKIIIMGVIQLLDNNGNPITDNAGCGVYAININHCQIIEQSPMIEERQVEQVPTTNKGLN